MEAIKPYFTCIPLGVRGGSDESNLSAYLLAPSNSKSFVSLDAGTLLAGLQVANEKGCFDDFSPPLDSDDSRLTGEGHILHHHVKAFLITHPFLDHVAGLVLISPDDSHKPICGLRATLEDIRDHLFNWRIWPNFASAGVAPALAQYDYVMLEPGKPTPIDGTTMAVSAFPLAHGSHTDSTAFLIEADGHYVLYMGDTGPDEVEKRPTTDDIWKRIAPLVRDGKLHGIFIEASYPDERPDALLYFHLTPAWIMRAFEKLAIRVDEQNPHEALRGLTIVITHIKPGLKAGTPVEDIVKKQLLRRNTLNLRFIFATQGERFDI